MFVDFANNKTDKLFDAIETAGGQMRVVGGAVRDLALGIKPKDFDFATDLPPETVMTVMADAGLEVIPTGLKHGTVTVVVDQVGYEITTLRADVETDGRHAVVDFVTDFKTDAARRDFTINALSADRNGTVFDYFDGLSDLHAGRVRFVGDAEKRVQEDYLRILRYFRFSARFGGNEDQDALAAIKKHAAGLKMVSVERIWKEISQILVHPNAVEQLNLMQSLGVTDVIHLPWDHHKAGQYRVLQRYTSDPSLLVGVIAGNPDEADLVALRWKFSTRAVDRAMKAADVFSDMSSDPKYWRIRQVEGYDLDVLEPVLLATGREEAARGLVAKPSVFPVYGRDLIALGFQAGKEIGLVLRELDEKWKDSDFTLTRDELLEMAMAKFTGENGCRLTI